MSKSNIIKQPVLPKNEAQAARPLMKRAVVEARAEARRIVSEAEEEAARLRAETEASANELREAAYREGLESALLELSEHLLDAREKRDTALAEVERDVLRLAVKLAEKIIGREIERDDTTLTEMVATALRNVRQHETVVIRVNPADMPVIQAHRENLDPAGRARFLDIVPDPRVSHGGCIIESDSGKIDAQLTTQLRVLERALLARAIGEGGNKR